ncbi:sulfotransferase domain-containing protein [Marinobacter santoriniensis NKSG1]|uniref:Sulfotransferase domain-containing protein n=1 Tax=Marinobacter santoriniensis NKSG1 TaxID=1288826 RepID=M7CQN0_9GAMM|nr:sulfotransferase domain-containing protein [Marinobacter santoriniensis NKSG1]
MLRDIHRLISVEFSIWKKDFSYEELKNLAVPGDIKSLIQNIFLEEAFENGKQHVFIKENHVYEFLPFLMSYFPESKFVYQTRDPRDMALSWKRNSGHPGGVVRAARQWKLDQQQSLKNYHLLEHQGKAHFVRYEDLTQNSEVEIRKILDFLGVPFDSEIFEFHNDEMTKKNAGMQNAWSNISKGIISNNSKKYLKDLTESEIKVVEKICWYEMKHLGYQTEFSYDALTSISEDWMDEMDQKEYSELELDRSEGVRANMAAKSRFYQR